MELKKSWFPLVLAAAWVLMAAVTLRDFAGFASATHQEEPVVIIAGHASAPVSHGRTPSRVARN